MNVLNTLRSIVIFVHHHLLQGTLCLCPIAFADQLADVFTKAHPLGRFRDLFFQTQVGIYITTLSLMRDFRIYSEYIMIFSIIVDLILFPYIYVDIIL
jgi:hypothetical protein